MIDPGMPDHGFRRDDSNVAAAKTTLPLQPSRNRPNPELLLDKPLPIRLILRPETHIYHLIHRLALLQQGRHAADRGLDHFHPGLKLFLGFQRLTVTRDNYRVIVDHANDFFHIVDKDNPDVRYCYGMARESGVQRIELLDRTKLDYLKVAGEVIAGEESTYDPGIWYNSAKFFDLEYQTYGKVSNVPVQGEHNLYWEHPNHQHAMRIITRNGIVIGINVMGLRYRHKVCERWIKEGKTLDYVLDNLSEANFDPEFYDKFEQEIRQTFREKAA